MARPQLRLRRLGRDDEAAAVLGHEQMLAEGFEFLLGWAGQPWLDYLAELEAAERGYDLAAGLVPDTFLIAVAGGALVGRVSIRHRLNDRLRSYGGHIGYGVLPAFRLRGFATEMFRQSLEVAGELGITHALVTCADDNHPSVAIIEKCGGVLESVDTSAEGRLTRRYWIDTR